MMAHLEQLKQHVQEVEVSLYGEPVVVVLLCNALGPISLSNHDIQGELTKLQDTVQELCDKAQGELKNACDDLGMGEQESTKAKQTLRVSSILVHLLDL